MIKIFTFNYSDAVTQAVDVLAQNGLPALVEVFPTEDELSRSLKPFASAGNTLILLGDTTKIKNVLVHAFNLRMFYDKHTEDFVKLSAERQNKPMPPQYELDAICSLPEGFTGFACEQTGKLVFCGEIAKAVVYVADCDTLTVKSLATDYVVKNVKPTALKRYVWRVFGLDRAKIDTNVSRLAPSGATFSADYKNLDCKLVLTFGEKCAKNVVNETLKKLRESFGENLYSEGGQTLAEKTVEVLSKLEKTLATAESITGGLIASNVVAVPGASAVLYEGLVTYSVDSKCKRLGLSPHFVDEYGVVSKQVAHKMAEGLLVGGVDYAIATTGYAGPDYSPEAKTGLCYIAIGTPKGISVFKNVFVGDRNSIRNQAANSALYLLLRSILG